MQRSKPKSAVDQRFLRRVLVLASLLLATPLQAQAPAEERRVSGDAVESSQQRISSLRREIESADQAVKQAEQDANNAQTSLTQARARAASAASALKAARERQARAREALRQEAAAFDALRQGASAPAGASKDAAKSSGKP